MIPLDRLEGMFWLEWMNWLKCHVGSVQFGNELSPFFIWISFCTNHQENDNHDNNNSNTSSNTSNFCSVICCGINRSWFRCNSSIIFSIGFNFVWSRFTAITSICFWANLKPKIITTYKFYLRKILKIIRHESLLVRSNPINMGFD